MHIRNIHTYVYKYALFVSQADKQSEFLCVFPIWAINLWPNYVRVSQKKQVFSEVRMQMFAMKGISQVLFALLLTGTYIRVCMY